MLADRALNDKALRGFVSWAKSYCKHQASGIFRIAELDWEDLGYALGKQEVNKSLGLKVDFPPYADKGPQREGLRR